MSCPFGFTAEDQSDTGSIEVQEIDCRDTMTTEEKRAEGRVAAEERKDKDKKKENTREEKPVQTKKKDNKAGKGKESRDNEKESTDNIDPLTWFQQNQIKSEQDFQERKAELQKEAKKRLESLAKAKKKLLDFGAEFDFGSVSSLSDLDSDVHSLASLKGCAGDWLEKTKFIGPAESWIKFSLPPALAVTAFCLYQSYTMTSLCTQMAGVVLNSHWSLSVFGVAGVMALGLALFHLSAVYRSKRMLLGSQLIFLIVYALSVLLIALMYIQPIELDVRLQDAACNRMQKMPSTSQMCTMMPIIGKKVAEAAPPLMTSCLSVCLTAMGLATLGVWYVFELTYVEKKASKHKRRNERERHSIPWSKIKIGGEPAVSPSEKKAN